MSRPDVQRRLLEIYQTRMALHAVRDEKRNTREMRAVQPETVIDEVEKTQEWVSPEGVITSFTESLTTSSSEEIKTVSFHAQGEIRLWTPMKVVSTLNTVTQKVELSVYIETLLYENGTYLIRTFRYSSDHGGKKSDHGSEALPPEKIVGRSPEQIILMCKNEIDDLKLRELKHIPSEINVEETARAFINQRGRKAPKIRPNLFPAKV